MAKGDDIVSRKKNKANRKKLQRKSDSSTVSARIASIIAAKKRRKSGKRRKCQGMCFSLPTPDDPFNDKLSKDDFETKGTKKQLNSQVQGRKLVDRKSAASKSSMSGKDSKNVDHLKEKNGKATDVNIEQKMTLTSVNNLGQKCATETGKAQIKEIIKNDVNAQYIHGNTECPSKYLILCLNYIERALQNDKTYINKDDKPLFANPWGNEFWKYYSVGKDILESSGACASTEQIAWIASTAADSITRKEKEGLSLTSPFILFLVPSREKAIKVRSVCKPLKALGIHSVSLHSGTSLDHQITGLKSCEPEFLVSTPGRLLDLISSGSLDVSGVCLLVVDDVEGHFRDGYLDKIVSISLLFAEKPYTVVFNNHFSHASVPAVRDLLTGSMHRFYLNNSIKSQSACIIQSVEVFVTEEEKLSKCVEVVEQACGSQTQSHSPKVLFIIKKGNKLHELIPVLEAKGHAVSCSSVCTVQRNEDSMEVDCERRRAVSMINEDEISTTALEHYEVVILPNFVVSIDNYTLILKRMARCTVKGVLKTFLHETEWPLSKPLIEILEQCGQPVPEPLRMLCGSSPMSR